MQISLVNLCETNRLCKNTASCVKIKVNPIVFGTNGPLLKLSKFMAELLFHWQSHEIK